MLSNWPRRIVAAIIFTVGILVGVAGWILFSPLFIDNVVDEGFPPAASAPRAPDTMPSPTELAEMPGAEREAMREEVLDKAAAMPNTEVVEDMPVDSGPALLIGGTFRDGDRIHKGSGNAGIYRLADGSNVLRFEDFESTNGPDLRVIVSSHPNPDDGTQVHEGFHDLGPLKGNVGNQNYVLPAGLEPDDIGSVIIYCRAFSVIFAVASLTDA